MSAAALDKSQVEFHPPAEDSRERRYKLRSGAARLLYRERVCTCGQKLVLSQASVVLPKSGGAYVTGLETCGSVWTCPVCAGKIAETRRGEVAKALSRHKGAGGHVYMMTLTVPHHGYETARRLREGVAEAWRKCIAGKAWTKRRDAFEIAFIRSLEITHGKNGWHPHLHVLVLTRDLDEAEAADLSAWLFDRWAKTTKRLGLGDVSARGFQFERTDSEEAAGEYVAKWGTDAQFGVDCEIAKAHVKVSRKGGRTPWQILADAMDGDPASVMLFREYAAAFKGARHLTWSKGLKARYGVNEKSDEEVARLETPHYGDQVLGNFRRVVWHRITRAGKVPALLKAAESGDGWQAVLGVLREAGLALTECEHARPDPIRWPPGRPYDLSHLWM